MLEFRDWAIKPGGLNGIVKLSAEARVISKFACDADRTNAAMSRTPLNVP